MISILLIACGGPGDVPPTDITYAVTVAVDEDPPLSAPEAHLLVFLDESLGPDLGDDGASNTTPCEPGNWVQTDYQGGDTPMSFQFGLGFGPAGDRDVVVDDTQSPISWGDPGIDHSLWPVVKGGTISVGDVSHVSIDLTVSGGQNCQRPNADSEEACTANESTIMVHVEGSYEGPPTGTGQPGYGATTGGNLAVCGR